MPGKEIEGVLLDVDYTGSGGRSIIRLFVRTASGIEIFEDTEFRPYFFVRARDTEKAEKALLGTAFSDGARISKISKPKRINELNILQLEFDSVKDLTGVRSEINKVPVALERFEHDIPFAKRYLLDHTLLPMGSVRLEVEGSRIIRAAPGAEKEEKYGVCAFDLETLSPGRFSDPAKDPVLMASFAEKNNAVVLSYGKKFHSGFVKTFRDEKEALSALVQKLQQGWDIICTYNGDSFDFPYLLERCKKHGIGFGISSDGSAPKIKKKGRDNAARLHGVQHLDAYKMLVFLARLGVVSLIKFDIESVVGALYGETKRKITAARINEIWETGEGLDGLADYCREDSESALRIGTQYLPLMVELCRIVKQTLFEVSRSSASMLVEYLIMNKCGLAGALIANKPDDETSKQRMLQTYKGGFVMEPLPGLHENIAILDFSSLHPTIMISHNISPDSRACGHEECRGKNSAPTGQWFCTKKEGLLVSILKELFERRMEIKKELKQAGKNSQGATLLDARQHALKILLNSFYGYLGYSRSRFYSRECAAAVTAWSRQYVQWVGEKAEKAGFTVLYGDTDSAHLEIPPEKSKKSVEEFAAGINSELPGVMNLEIEGFYRRGIFVTKESGEGAKKKYALIDHDGRLKIVGFEYVRRDWAPIAKETQKEVIMAILRDGSPEKAIGIIRDKVRLLKEGRVPKKDLVVLTQIKKPLGKYESIGPHVAAAKKAIARGREIDVGSVIGYVITRSGKSISDRSCLEEYVNEGNYDADYYIQNQVIPAVIKIMKELGYSREDLVQGGKQSSIGSFC